MENEKKKILVTGGAGFIGSHTAVELLNSGYDIVIVDSLVNASEMCIHCIKEITGKEFEFHKLDLCTDVDRLDKIFQNHKFHSVIHFAGLKAVGESTQIPLKYFYNNLTSTINLLQIMEKYKVWNLVFSSSSTVYGNPDKLPITEESPLQRCTNSYGRTKFFIEEILRDLSDSNKSWNFVNLRYFNPVGAHKSGKIGEDPKGIPNNLMPFISQVAIGKRKKLSVFGHDYPTHDGTGVRDYIHVVDLAIGHVAALKIFSQNPNWVAYNLGTGVGYSVLDIVKAFQQASGREIPYEIVARRPGDIAASYANVDKAHKDLGWKAERGLKEMCEDSWRWQSNNPEGFAKL